MTWHPLTWAFWAAVAAGILLYGIAAVRAMDVFLNWQPDCAEAHQLRREHGAEIASLLADGSFACFTAAAVLGLMGVAVGWHPVVPGAMCGTGVLQAMGSYGRQAMIFWGIGLAILAAWRVLDRLNRRHPEWAATRSAGRMLLTAAPFLLLAVYSSWQALMHAESVPAVSCCAAVYDRVLTSSGEPAYPIRIPTLSFWVHLIGGMVLMVLAIFEIRAAGRMPGAVTAAIAIVWSVGASAAVKHVWSAYYYQVLSHPCPWCLFLPDYHGAGFLIFGCMAVIVMEAVAVWSADSACRRHPQLAKAAHRRRHRSGWRITWALIGFTIAAAGPAIAWRLSTGAWMKDLF